MNKTTIKYLTCQEGSFKAQQELGKNKDYVALIFETPKKAITLSKEQGIKLANILIEFSEEL